MITATQAKELTNQTIRLKEIKAEEVAESELPHIQERILEAAKTGIYGISYGWTLIYLAEKKVDATIFLNAIEQLLLYQGFDIAKECNLHKAIVYIKWENAND